MACGMYKALQQTELKTSKEINYGNVYILDNPPGAACLPCCTCLHDDAKLCRTK
jgi:hypothetical protein